MATIKRETDGSIILTISLPKEKIQKVWEEELTKKVENTTLPGFRKGKAPKAKVLEKIDKADLKEEVLKKLLPETYLEAITELKLKPVMSPKIHIDKIDDDTDWEYTATLCEKPVVDLKDYKEAIKTLNAKGKIIIPGKEQQAQGPSFDDIVKTLLEHISAPIPHILIEAEADRMLSQLLDDIKKLGLTLDQYVGSTHKSIEGIRKEYEDKAKNEITLEFALQQIAEAEKISVEQKELEEAVAQAKDDKERENLKANMYLLANILRQQKTLDFLKNL